MSLFFATLRKEFRIAVRQPFDSALPLAFFVIVLSLFPIALGENKAALPTLFPSLLWVAALLSILLSLDSLYQDDFDDGSLDLLLLSDAPLACVYAKSLNHWVFSALPLVVTSPLAALASGLAADTFTVVILGLLLGTPVLCLLGSIGAALTVGLRNGGALVGLLILPLNIPVMVWGAALIRESMAGGTNVAAYLLLLGALLIISLVFAPLVVIAGLKISNG